MTSLTFFGLVAVIAMLLTYAAEDRSPVFVLAFAGSCVMASVYGFLQGAWPFGVVEAIWSLVALRRWWQSRRPHGIPGQGLGSDSFDRAVPGRCGNGETT